MTMILSAPALLLLSPIQVPTALLREGDALPGTTSTVGIISNVNADGGVGFAVTGYSEPTDAFCYTRTRDGVESVRFPRTIGGLDQIGIGGEVGLTDSSLAYSSGIRNASGSYIGSGLWIDDALVVAPGTPSPVSGWEWYVVSNVQRQRFGRVSFIGGIRTGPGNPIATALLSGLSSMEILVMPGASYPDLPAPLALDNTAVNQLHDVSPSGDHHIAVVGMQDGDGLAIMVDGRGLLAAGSLVQIGTNVPPSVMGSAGEWRQLNHVEVSDSGSYAVGGWVGTSPSQLQGFILRDGVAEYRGGDAFGAETLFAAPEQIAMGPGGELAFQWKLVLPGMPPRSAMFYEGEIVMREGDVVDWSGDGVADPDHTLVSFGSKTLEFASHGALLFDAVVDTPSGLREALIELPLEIGTSTCIAELNSTGSRGELSIFGSSSRALDRMGLSATSLPPYAFGYFIVADQIGFTANPGGSAGNLCVSGAIGRYTGPGQIQSSGPAGAITLQVDFDMIPTPTGFLSAGTQETWLFQAWFRDTVGMQASSNFTNASEVMMRN